MNFRKNKKEDLSAVDSAELQSASQEMAKLEEATVNGIKEADKAAVTEIDEEFLAQIKLQEEEMQKNVPGFDLALEIEKNPMFAVMLSFREPMDKVFEYFNSEFLQSRIEQEVVEKIKSRKLRPSHIEPRGKNGGYDVTRLSDKDMQEIDKRVRRGERIEL